MTTDQHPLAYLLGLEGIALMQAFAGEHDRAFTRARLREVRWLLDEADRLGDGVDLPDLPVADAYDGWAPTYDDPANGLLAMDAEVVQELLGDAAPGVALDLACGTGRHARWLLARGHDVIGVDVSPGMLAVAERDCRGARFVRAGLDDLPLPEGSVDVAVCSLALTHLPHVGPALAEAARVLRPGGRLVLSDTRSLFPASVRYPLVQRAVDGRVGVLPGWHHSEVDVLRAALGSGLEVLDVREVALGVVQVRPVEHPEVPVPGEPVSPWALMEWVPEAATAAYAHRPALLVWHLRRRTP